MLSLCLEMDKKQIYIISVSGGIDSMVLLDYLYHLQYNLIVVHFNHLKRKESLKDKILIKEYCLLKKIPFYYFELNIEDQNFQNKARILRKEKLKLIASKYKTPYLITAHHLDDLAETILLKLSRGSSLLGYSGMQSSYCHDNFYFLKPFLYISKDKITSYAIKNAIPFLEDYTNKLNIYTRNKIRNQIIPFFKKINNFLKNIQKFHFQITEMNTFLKRQTNFFLKKMNNNFFDLKSFLQLDIVIQKDIIVSLLEKKNIYKNFYLINNIVKGLQNNNKPNITWAFPSLEWLLIKQYHKFFWQKKIKTEQVNQMTKPSLHYNNKNVLSFCSSIQQIFYDVDRLQPPFILRQKQPGDILQFHFGRQKLKKFLINSKINLTQREKIWLVVDQQNIIIWIPRLYFNSTLGDKQNIYFGIIE
ncbi:MAG: tRNA lysidine(34) synthetase TilS [Phytoplasma sp.]|uniref:tRNA lysidine(34) synthetase TilS n=1 Tax=Phytoplasma sp. TaxID=2155 RepID=UPI002B40AF09|nr:tRNA lysidine(34) synthetase TilS [Phytoplasma sp.]WRH06787.1 MAG: tRNA lysidine(34) synthetase TilS [Phytoplasma sp.]